MPLYDHFRPPLSKRHSWQGFHATWPVMLVGRLNSRLPAGYVAEPRSNLGRYYEVDIGGFETEGDEPPVWSPADNGGGVVTLTQTVAEPTLTVEIDIGEQYEYEVLVFDVERDRTLVAAVEFVSPANKDRPEHRQAFVAKCSALLQKGVSVAIVDPVTTRQANLYAELLDAIGTADPAFGPDTPFLYAVSCRTRTVGHRPRLDAWAYPLAVGNPLPPLPLWLTTDVPVELDLNGSYDDTCRLLGVG